MTKSEYSYDPSFAGAVVFAVFFTIACAATTFQFFWYRCWFWVFFVIGAWMEAVGYIDRSASVKNVYNQPLNIVQFLLIFLAPPFLAASCYMAMGRIVLHVTPPRFRNLKTLWVSPRWLTPIFVTCDVIAFLIQVIGGTSSTSNNTNTKQQGYNIMKIGLYLQIVCFSFFLIISFRFHIVARCFRDQWPDSRWTRLLWAVNIGSTLIFIRSVYRLIEFSIGFDGYLATHEWNFFVFESLIILPIFYMFNVIHPAEYIININLRQDRSHKVLDREALSNADMDERIPSSTT